MLGSVRLRSLVLQLFDKKKYSKNSIIVNNYYNLK